MSDVMTKTYTVGDVMRLFDLDAGSAWELIIDRGWECVQPLPHANWQIAIPPGDLPALEWVTCPVCGGNSGPATDTSCGLCDKTGRIQRPLDRT